MVLVKESSQHMYPITTDENNKRLNRITEIQSYLNAEHLKRIKLQNKWRKYKHEVIALTSTTTIGGLAGSLTASLSGVGLIVGVPSAILTGFFSLYRICCI